MNGGIGAPSGRGQAHDEAGAEHPRSRWPAPVRFSTQIVPPCASTICLEIDRPKPGILPEALFRPVGIEALEDLIQRFRPDAGPVVVDRISTSSFSRRQVMRTVPPGGENERALSIRLLTTWPSRES